VEKRIGTARLLVETQHEATLIPAAAIQRNACAGLRASAKLGCGTKRAVRDCDYESSKAGSVGCLNVITAQTTVLKNETIAIKIPGPANELYFV
jgi:hypothetical protein